MRKLRRLARFRLPPALVRCAASSLAAVAVEFVLLVLFVSVMHMHYLTGMVLSTAVYLLINFLLNRAWAFNVTCEGTRHAAWQFGKHIGVAGIGMGLAMLMMRFFVNTVGMPYQLGWAAAGCINFGTWTWPMNRFFTFGGKAEPSVA